jgi:hypothetical protein
MVSAKPELQTKKCPKEFNILAKATEVVIMGKPELCWAFLFLSMGMCIVSGFIYK